MKKILSIFALVAAAAALVSCKEDNGFELNVPPTIDVTSGANIAFKAIGGSGSIEIAPSEGQLQATTAQSDWCHLTVSGNRIDVSVDAYDGLESRYAIVDMKAGNATGQTIVQQFGVIVKAFSWKDFTVKNEKQTVEFSYDANESVVQATSDADWLSFDATPETFSIHIAQNPTTDYREALVHWTIGEVQGDITVGQFDLTAAGLLGSWTWHGSQAPNNRDFPMSATLAETGDGVYSLALSASSSSYALELSIQDITLSKNNLMLPLGQYVGTYTLTRTGVVYDTYTLLAPGTARIKYDDAVSEGLIPLSLVKDESGQWKAVCDMSSYPDTQFRFEMWNQPGEDDDPHEGNSASGLSLSNIYLVKE